jgi:hypothetical protein
LLRVRPILPLTDVLARLKRLIFGSTARRT